jgi:hypothetical protein
VLRKASDLPITLHGAASATGCTAGGSDRVGGGMAGVTGDMGGCGGMAGGTRSGTGRRVIGSSGGGMSGTRSSSRSAHGDFAAHPATRSFEGFPGSIVVRVLCLEGREHVLGAVRGPERQRPVIVLVEPHVSSSLCVACPTLCGSLYLSLWAR